MTTKLTVATAVVIGSMTGFWFSIATKLDTNSNASTALITSIDARAAVQTEQIVETVNKNQDAIKKGIEQNKETLAKLEIIATQFTELAQQIKELSEQNNELTEQSKTMLIEMNQVLNQHTKTLAESNKKASEAVHAAQVDHAQTQRAIRQIEKPKKPWWQNILPP